MLHPFINIASCGLLVNTEGIFEVIFRGGCQPRADVISYVFDILFKVILTFMCLAKWGLNQ